MAEVTEMIGFLTPVCICIGFTGVVVYLREILLEVRAIRERTPGD